MLTKEVLEGLNNIMDIEFRSIDEKIHRGKFDEWDKLKVYKLIRGNLKGIEQEEHSRCVWLWNMLEVRDLWQILKQGGHKENLTKAMAYIADKYREHYKTWLDWAEEQRALVRAKHENE